MTKAFLLIAFGLIVSMSVSRADDITLSDGTVLKNAKVVQRDDSTKTVTISFSGGTAQVHSEMLPTGVAIVQTPAPPMVPHPTATVPALVTSSASDSPMPTDWTVDGRQYHNVKVGDVEADRVHITFDGGLGTVQIADLPPDLQKRFNYDPAAANAMTQQREQQAAQSDAQVYAAQAQNDKQQAQQAQAAAAAKNSQRAVLEKQIASCTEALRYDEKSLYGQSWNAVDKARAEGKIADDQARLAALQAKLANLSP